MSSERAVLMTTEEEITTAEETPIPCFRCGICCTCYQPPLLPEDIESIASALGISRSECISSYALKVPTKEGYLLRKTGRGCVFLSLDEDEKARCAIYPSRPQACREWQPSLSQPACVKGLARLKSKGQLARLNELFRSDEEQREFYLSLERVLPPHDSG